MQVKTYTGPSTQAVLAQIKSELGPDAVILSTRSGRKEGRRFCEVTAGVERNGNGSTPRGAGAVADGGDPTQLPAGWESWHREWSCIKEHLLALMKPGLRLEQLTPRQRLALEFLEREGVEDTVLMSLYRRLLTSPGASVLEPLTGMVPVKPWSREAWPQRVHVFAGPFGSGKTTTLVRMALRGQGAESAGGRVQVVNADCERGNGRLLLRHWAELSGFGYAEAADDGAMRAALDCDADRVFVDLPGLARGETLTQRLAHLGLGGDDVAVHLVLPPHCGGQQTADFVNRYRAPGTASIVWTKLDEACTYGTLVNVAAANGLPVSALSFGPGLRGSLVSASESALWRLVFKRQLPGRTSDGPAARQP